MKNRRQKFQHKAFEIVLDALGTGVAVLIVVSLYVAATCL